MYVREMIPWTWGRKVGRPRNRAAAAAFPYFDHQVSNLFDELARDFEIAPFGSLGKKMGLFNPRLNFVENDKAFEVSVELPGINEKDIHLSLEEDTLTIQGEKKNEKKEEKNDVYRMERSYGTFQRTIALPSGVEEEKIEATFKKGVLNIILPKSEEAQKDVRQIPVKTA